MAFCVSDDAIIIYGLIKIAHSVPVIFVDATMFFLAAYKAWTHSKSSATLSAETLGDRIMRVALQDSLIYFILSVRTFPYVGSISS